MPLSDKNRRTGIKTAVSARGSATGKSSRNTAGDSPMRRTGTVSARRSTSSATHRRSTMGSSARKAANGGKANNNILYAAVGGGLLIILLAVLAGSQGGGKRPPVQEEVETARPLPAPKPRPAPAVSKSSANKNAPPPGWRPPKFSDAVNDSNWKNENENSLSAAEVGERLRKIKALKQEIGKITDSKGRNAKRQEIMKLCREVRNSKNATEAEKKLAQDEFWVAEKSSGVKSK